MKHLRKSNYIFHVLGFGAAIFSAMVDAKMGRPFTWQLICAVWIANGYIQLRTIDNLENKD